MKTTISVAQMKQRAREFAMTLDNMSIIEDTLAAFGQSERERAVADCVTAYDKVVSKATFPDVFMDHIIQCRQAILAVAIDKTEPPMTPTTPTNGDGSPRIVLDAVVKPVGRWGRKPSYQAKIGTMPGSIIVVRRARRFGVGQWLAFADTADMRGMSVGMPPKWRRGRVWKIENDRLFIELV